MTTVCSTRSSETDRDHAVETLVEAYDGHVHQLLRDLADHLEVSLAYVDQKTVEAHLERELTAGEWQSFRRRFRAMDFDDHVGDQGTVRTDWIETVLDRAGVAGRSTYELGGPS